LAETGIEGRLLIDLNWHQGRVFQVAIGSTRPLQLPEIFFAKKPAEVLATLPLIYRVCGVAQGCAAAEALEQAGAIPVAARNRQKRRLLVAFETLREHFWRIELDWARFLNRVPDRVGVVQISSLLKKFRATLFPEGGPFTLGGLGGGGDKTQLVAQLEDLERLMATRVFSQSPQSWLEISDRLSLGGWSKACETLSQEMLSQVKSRGEAGLGQTQVAALGKLDPVYLDERLGGVAANDFIAQPDWQGAPAETTPFTRRCNHPMLISLRQRYGNGLLTRLVARLVELAALAGELRKGVVGLDTTESAGHDSDVGSGIGISQIEAARGRLVHRVELEAGRISRYQILAPTEWNFHPKGVLARGLAGLESTNETDLKRRADLLINAIDPCVGYRLQINRCDDIRE
jgi:hypothetical protein